MTLLFFAKFGINARAQLEIACLPADFKLELLNPITVLARIYTSVYIADFVKKKTRLVS